MKHFSIGIVFILFHLLGLSQEMLGVIHSNYAGIYAIGINPAGMVASKLYLDFNLISAQGYFDNDYAYISRDDFVGLVRDKVAPRYYTDAHEARAYGIYRNNDFYSGFQNAKFMGPGAMLVDGKHAFGITSSFRTLTAFRGMPNDVALFLYEAIDFKKQHNITYNHDTPILAASMSWFELGLSYAINFYRKKWSYWSAGITLKPLFGSSGAFTSISHVNYEVLDDTTALVNDASFQYGLAVPLNYNTNAFELNPVIRGFGFGVDLGVMYQFTTKGYSTTYFTRICEQPYEDYNFRIGLSLIDLGYIKFKKEAVFEQYTNTHTSWYKPDDVLPDSTINTIVGKIDYYFKDAQGDIVKTNDFVMYLPPAFSFQADINLWHHWYLNTSAILGLQISKQSIYRPSLISIAPRYETARWEFSLPVSVLGYNFKNPQIGVAFRYGNLFAGIDRINTLTGFVDFTGVDAYAGIRLNLSNLMHLNFIKGYCGLKKARNIETFDYRNF